MQSHLLYDSRVNGTTKVLISHLTHFWSPVAYYYGMQTKPLGHSLGHTADSFMFNFRNLANELGLLTGSDLQKLRLSEKPPKVSQVTFSVPFSPPISPYIQ